VTSFLATAIVRLIKLAPNGKKGQLSEGSASVAAYEWLLEPISDVLVCLAVYIRMGYLTRGDASRSKGFILIVSEKRYG